ncbi:uncharacterized protein YjbI with pentapeptide repeats [Oxalobacteraceae bacterium GrIS 2.11]
MMPISSSPLYHGWRCTPPPRPSLEEIAIHALQFSLDGECLNPHVLEAIVKVLNNSNSEKTVRAKILENSVEFRYQFELNQIIQEHCKDFRVDCRVREILSDNWIGVEYRDDASLFMTRYAGTRDGYSFRVSRELEQLKMPETVENLIIDYARMPEKCTAHNLEKFECLFKEGGCESHKLIVLGDRDNLDYLKKIFSELNARGIQPDLTGLSFSWRKMPGYDFPDYFFLKNVDLSFSKFDQTIFGNISFSGSTLAHVTLCFSETGPTLTGAKLPGSTLYHAQGRFLRQADLRSTTLVEPDFSGEDLTTGIILKQVTIESGKMVDASLRYRDISNAIWKDVDVTGADCTGIDFRDSILINVNLEKASSVTNMKVNSTTMANLSLRTRMYLNHCIFLGRVIFYKS